MPGYLLALLSRSPGMKARGTVTKESGKVRAHPCLDGPAWSLLSLALPAPRSDPGRSLPCPARRRPVLPAACPAPAELSLQHRSRALGARRRRGGHRPARRGREAASTPGEGEGGSWACKVRVRVPQGGCKCRAAPVCAGRV